ncbi:hypothetical protein C1H46_045883 [Malus baccata]|uniref:Uncharacterized protein n=1 Tax=Malus baccata TaxID=106549 RepID=A0A540K2S4_MALBA|nr:hypothetical protein C1H46_045883 [Malus baccata]
MKEQIIDYPRKYITLADRSVLHELINTREEKWTLLIEQGMRIEKHIPGNLGTHYLQQLQIG